MKKSSPIPAGPILMAAGIALLVLCALATELFPWFRVALGLAGFVMFFVGFRFLGGPSYFVCPHCGAKIHNWNRWIQIRRKEATFRCPRCQTILRSDGGTII